MENKKRKIETYKYIGLLGEGSYGKVYLVISNSTKKYYAMKTIEISQLNEEQKKEALQEAKILKKLDHPNIIKLKEVFIAKKPKETLNIITEYADGEDLSKKIKHNLKMNQKFPEDKILDWFTQICLAVYYIQKNKILHRDIKPQNVFLTKSSMVKLGDFGISKNLNTTWEKAVTFIGTPYYISPEIVQNQPYSFKSDIWSLGVLLYELIALKYPFDASSLPKLMIKIMKGQYMKIKDKNFSTELKNLVYMILNVNPDKRPGIKDILDMPIMKNRSAILLKEVEYDKKITDKYIKDFINSKKERNKIAKTNTNDLTKKNFSSQNLDNNEIKKTKTNIGINSIEKENNKESIEVNEKHSESDKGLNMSKDKKLELKQFLNKKSGENIIERKPRYEQSDKTFDDLKNYFKIAKEEINNNKSNPNIHFKKDEEFYNVNRYINILSSFMNGEEEETPGNNIIKNENENEQNNNNNNTKKDVENNEIRDNNNISEKEALLNSNLGLYQIKHLLPKEVEEIKKLKRELEKVYGKENIEKLEHYVSLKTDKNILKYDEKAIIEEIKNGIERKELNISIEKINDIINLIPDIFSFVIAKKIIS